MGLALAEAELPPEELRELLDQNFKRYFEPETDELRSDVYGSRAQLLKTLRLVLTPVCNAASAVAAESALLRCPGSQVHCGVWDWYLRGLLQERSKDVDYFSSVHLDGKLMLGKKTRRADNAWGGPRVRADDSAEDKVWW